MHDLRDVGGTSGGLVSFLVGLGLAGLGAYLLMDRVTVYGGFWSFYGMDSRGSFGVTLLPVLFGLGTLFYDGRSKLGWLLFVGGLLVILAGIIASMEIYFQATSLPVTLIILFTMVAGVGLILRSLRPSRR